MAFSFRLVIILLLLTVLNSYFCFKQRWDCIFSLLFMLLLFIPSDLVGIFSGYPYSSPGRINISIVGYDVLSVWLCALMSRNSKIKIWKNTFLIIIESVCLLLVLRLCIDGIDCFSNKILDNYFLPVLLAILIIGYMPQEIFPSVMRTIFICILVNALAACAEVLIGRSLLFHNYYMNTVAWYQAIYGVTTYNINMRGTAFLGHPLINGLYCVLGYVYLYNYEWKRKYLKGIAFIILFGGLLASNSRGALLVFLLYTAFSLFSKKQYGKIAAMAAILLVVLICAYAFGMLNFGALYAALFPRDAGGDSMLYRFSSIMAVSKIPVFVLLFGTGYNNTSSVLRQIGIAGNFEIAYLIVLLENGLIGFALWLRSLTLLYRANMIGKMENLHVKKMINGMIFCMMLLSATGNYFGDPGTLNYMLWALFAFSGLMYRFDLKGQAYNSMQEEPN